MYLNCHTWFSFKYGTMPVKDLLAEAQQLGISQLALTDINNTSGCLDFIRLAPRYGIKPIVGIDFRNGIVQQFVGLACNDEGFFELNRFLSEHLHSGTKLPDRAPAFKQALIIYPFTKVPAEPLRENEFVGVSPLELNKFLFSPWNRKQENCVAQVPVTFRNKRDFNAHRLLRAIHHNTLLSKLPLQEQGNSADMLLSETELARIYAQFPALLENSIKLLDRCGIGITFGTSKNKKTFTGSDQNDSALLRKLCEDGIPKRYGAWTDELHQRVEKELDLISRQGFSAYFLISHDIVSYAHRKGYYYVGRGSGANSIVAYLLRITDVDPIELDLYFERFMNEFRVNPPDFDIDFSWRDRDDIIAYIFKRHGAERTVLLATYTTLQSNSLIRELGKVFGLPKAEIDNLGSKAARNNPDDHIARLILKYSEYLHDFPTHLSIHAGGILISEKPIHYYTATSLPPKGFPITQFSMLEAEDVGLYKFDILSQRGLGHIRDAVDLVKQNRGIEIDIHDVPAFKEDPKIREQLSSARTMGCFYVESPAMRMLLKKLHATTYLDLVAASSIIRPGVAQSGMMREYILRFRDPTRRQYIHPMMEELMRETYGIMVYQEDVIKVAHYFAGLTLAESDVLRRGMSGKFRGREEFQKAKDKFLSGCRKKGYEETVTFEVWRQVESFAGYSFSKAHSASYAVESYQSMYLKAYYPLEFMVGVINNFGGFYRTEYYVHEAAMAGGTIEAPCVNHSEQLTSIRGATIYLGFGHISELEHKASSAVLAERVHHGAYQSLADFVRRVSISVEQLRLLIKIGAFRFTGRTKKELLWDLLGLLGHGRKTHPAAELFEVPTQEFKLPDLNYTGFEDAIDQLELLGFPMVSPFLLLNDQGLPDTKASDLPAAVNNRISIVGYFVCHKPTRTIKGETMFFGTFLDRAGFFFDTVHFPPVAARFPFQGRGCYLLSGKITEEFEFFSMEVEEMEKVGLREELVGN
jgi:DNA polymerase-3 subunit alpha